MSDFEHMFLYYAAAMTFALAAARSSEGEDWFGATVCFLISVASLVTGLFWFARLVFS